MLGYVTVEQSELKVRELDVYQGYYCGLCKSIGMRLGQVPRMALSFDAVFLAIVLASLEEGDEKISKEHCIVHPIKKNPTVRESSALDYAADMMVILAYHKFLDDKIDENSLKGSAGCMLLKRTYKKLEKQYPEVCGAVELGLRELSLLEKENSPSIDLTSDAFGVTLEAVFTGYFEDESVNRVLSVLGRNLGKWIYIMDALDDLEDDREKGCYNPFIYRKGGSDFVEPVMYNYMAMALNAVDLLDFKKNKGIIDNILLIGMRKRTDLILGKGIENSNEKSI